MLLPILTDVTTYMGQSAATYSNETLTSALVAEIAAQQNVCTVGTGELPAALWEALLRRVARNVAMRRLPLGVMADEMGAVRIGSNDPEIRRLEGPYRKRVVG